MRVWLGEVNLDSEASCNTLNMKTYRYGEDAFFQVPAYSQRLLLLCWPAGAYISVLIVTQSPGAEAQYNIRY